MTAAAGLGDPVSIGAHSAPSRLLFGPHETNLGTGRALSDRHVAYYARRAAGGAGVIVVETASVTSNDWPYERAPLASDCGPGWRAVADACAPYGTVVLAGLGHAGGQGSSAYSQEVMWAPSAVADVVSREMPAILDEKGISAIVAAFGAAAVVATRAGLPGVEIDAGAWSLLRQFQSGLTNQRGDRYGEDRLLLTRQVIDAVRRAVGSTGVVALRLSCDELAPWAGVTPELAEPMVAELAPLVDLLTVVRAGPFSTGAYRPDGHTPAGFNRDLCRQMRAAGGGRAPVALQGSVVAPDMADAALAAGDCDLVEMTRALIADADLLTHVRAGRPERVRPCILCNQTCRVRDPRNPIVSCVVDPDSGYETRSPSVSSAASVAPASDAIGSVATASGAAGSVSTASGAVRPGRPVLVVGGGPAGLECARVLAEGGRTVHLVERSARLGGTLAAAAVGSGRDNLRSAVDWLAAETQRLGVDVQLTAAADAGAVTTRLAEGWDVVLATGSAAMTDRWPHAGLPIFDPLTVLADPSVLPTGVIAVADPVGDGVAVNLAEWLATAHQREVVLICPDQVAGTQLARTGDLADANGRLQRAGVTRRLRTLIRAIDTDGIRVEDCWTGAPDLLPAAAVVDCGHRLPDEGLYLDITAGGGRVRRIGDCVAPRTLLEAILEGRRAAADLLGSPAPAGAVVAGMAGAGPSGARR
ncbi:MAG TPA: FAD-dependent oxidoreductase [Acidimicrobiales bacterium]|nr:FAD-dependent oxidoreductase [Acidimicrobiales bacterium]